MARKYPSNAANKADRKEKTNKNKNVETTGETKEQLMSRVKGELLKTFITAAIAMAIGLALDLFVKF